MDKSFWHNKWKNNEIGFHLQHPNPNLIKHLDRFKLGQPSKVFVPLCGKSVDIHYLHERGHTVAGVELSETAVQQLFKSLGIKPEKSNWKGGTIYQGSSVKIFVGDFFELKESDLGPIDLVYDRAALIALPEKTRIQYTKHVTQITGTATQLLVTMVYNQNEMDGPPFSVAEDEIKSHYQDNHKIHLLDASDILEQNERFKQAGLTTLEERVYQLDPIL